MRQRLLPQLLLPLALLCAAAALGAATAVATPLGGVNAGSVGPSATLAGIDSSVKEAKALHAKVLRVEIPWSGLEPSRQGAISPQALALSDRLFSDAAASGIKVIAIADSTPCWDSTAPPALLSRCTPAQADHRQRVAAARSRALRSLHGLPRAALRHQARGDRGVERARPGQRRLPRGPRQGPALRRDPARRLSGDQAAPPLP